MVAPMDDPQSEHLEFALEALERSLARLEATDASTDRTGSAAAAQLGIALELTAIGFRRGGDDADTPQPASAAAK